MAAHRDAIERALPDRYGRTYAEDAGIRLADKPAPQGAREVGLP